jgi:hypothetical protein
MKDIKFIETIVVAYYRENRDSINVERLEEILKDSLNIEFSSIILENKTITVCYGLDKKIIFEFNNEKIKIKKEPVIRKSK